MAQAQRPGDGSGNLATEWGMPFIPEDGGNGPSDIPFGNGDGGGGRTRVRRVSGLAAFAGRMLMIFGLLVLLGGAFTGLSMRGESVQGAPVSKVISLRGGAPPLVHIDNSIGSVNVIAGAGDKIQVQSRVTVRHLSRGLAEKTLESYTIDVDDSKQGEVTIGARQSAPFPSDGVFPDWMIQRSVDLTVVMPANGNLDLNVAAGHMTVDGITGKVNAEVNAGRLEFTNTKLADGSTLKVNAGSLDFTGELLPDASLDLTVNAGGAELWLPKNTNANLDATANAGSVSAVGWPTLDTTKPRNGNTQRLSGVLFGEKNTKSKITVTVHAGSAEINPQVTRPEQPARPETPPTP